MRLSKYEQLRSKRDGAFQRKVLETLARRDDETARRGATGHFFGRVLKCVNSGSFLAVLGISVSFGIFYHHTYVACVADARKFYRDYGVLKMELFLRQSDIAASVHDATSIKDLRERLGQNKFFDRQFRDDTTIELQAREIVRATSIDMSGVGPDQAQKFLENTDAFKKYKSLFANGAIDDRTLDVDLPTLRQLAIASLEVNVLSFLAVPTKRRPDRTHPDKHFCAHVVRAADRDSQI
jgi:hypothetical protein